MYEAITHKNSIPISRLGKLQLIDIERSHGLKLHNDYLRVCTVLKGPKHYAMNGDKSPYIMSHMFGDHFLTYNNQIIVQTATCPYKCPYCYVDRLKSDMIISPKVLIEEVFLYRNKVRALVGVDCKVFHLMGGDPAIYAEQWPVLRKEMDRQGLKDMILYSDCLLTEQKHYGVKPWEYVNIKQFCLTCSLKGSDEITNIEANGGYNDYNNMINAIEMYKYKKNVYFTVIGHRKQSIKYLKSKVYPSELYPLKIVNYETTKRRMEGYL